MKNPFSPAEQGEMNLRRNQYDLSRNSLFTTNFGQLYPFFCQEVIPGDSSEIDCQIGVRAMPTVFPLQTRVRISAEFYLCRNRTVYNQFEDFIFKTKDLTAPWLQLDNTRAKKMICTGSLGDALGVPSSIGSVGSGSVAFSSHGKEIDLKPLLFGNRNYAAWQPTPTQLLDYLSSMNPSLLPEISSSQTNGNALLIGTVSSPIDFVLTSESRIKLPCHISADSSYADSFAMVLGKRIGYQGVVYYEILASEICPFTIESSGTAYQSNAFSDGFLASLSLEAYEEKRILIGCNPYNSSTGAIVYAANSTNTFMPVGGLGASATTAMDWTRAYFDKILLPEVVDATNDDVIGSNPFVGENPDIKINALPFRAYEQVTNYYYRNDKNNPYMLDGEAQYNEFIPSHDGGADTNLYDFHYRNWELDRFTSAVQSPQFGEAPLVGLTYNINANSATLTLDTTAFVTSQDPAHSVQEQAKVVVGVDDSGNIASILDFSKNVPSANIQKLREQILAGISINDLRLTNSFQRFLENILRRGLRYRNQLKSHFGVSVDYPDIDIPQYIGGVSGVLDTGQINNMSETGAVGLGDYVGTLSGGVALKHKIHCYTPEHGYILGIVSIVPIPSYAQSINKSLIKTDAFDYFLPEFGKIGYVPIHYSELSPLQNVGAQSVNDVFGYQKAWYDYMQATDEVHGDFRISLKDFVLTRTFGERPELCSDFTVVNPAHLNDVFTAANIATEYGSTARFLCKSHTTCKMKRVIPEVGTPSLE